MSERWKNIPGYAGLYEVSSQGRIRSNWHPKAIFMRPTSNGRGYLGVNLTAPNRTKKRRYVHDLVCRAFNAAPKLGQEVNHKDGDKSNNVYKNLEWVSRAENHQHRIAHLKQPNTHMKGRTGEKHPRSKVYTVFPPTGEPFLVHGLRSFCAQNALLENSALGVISGRLKQHRGYIFKKGNVI